MDNLVRQAIEVIKANDRGTYTVPTHGLYPFQWNWDSALTALGLAHYDEARAWQEIETLFEHQWPDGMVPHIIFHKPDDGYFPGPEIWRTGRDVPTTGITQPAVAGFAVRRIFDRARDRTLADNKARALLEKVHAWHKWFYRCRDPKGTGLVAILHPWESGRDNSIDWDEAFTRVPTEGVTPFQRRDIIHANPSHRPTDEQYKRYIWLLERFRGLDWDNTFLHDASPFRIVDPGFNAILIRACSDIADLADRLGEPQIARESRDFSEKGQASLEGLWSEAHGQYVCFDRAAGRPVDSASVGGLIAGFSAIPKARASALVRRIEDLSSRTEYLVPSHDPADPRYGGKRYWRGPVWLIVNYLIADGLRQAGEAAMAEKLFEDSLRLIRTSGFAEYYDPQDGEPCGGGSFTWTAAMVIELLSGAKEPA